MPTRAELLQWLREQPGPTGKRDVIRAFQVRGDDKETLKAMLKSLERDGAIEGGRSRRIGGDRKQLGTVAVLEITGIDDEGGLNAKPADWEPGAPLPRIWIVAEEGRSLPALVKGDRVLAQLTPHGEARFAARIMRKLEGAAEATRVVSVYEVGPRGARLRPTDKRAKFDLSVLPEHANGAQHGELVLAEIIPSTRMGLRHAKVIQRMGATDDPRAISLIAIHAREIPTLFSDASLAEAERAPEPTLAGRTDLRDIPLVTIDGADARDFDDAVWAEPDSDPAGRGGWHLLVAIADVSSYVTPGSALDKDAQERGNSVYFPDRVVPMLPERLSNGLCSLVPHQPRACLAFHLWIDAQGELKRHQLVRGLMRSAARLTYEQVQQAADGNPDDVTGPLLVGAIKPLYGAYAALLNARERRGTLDLELPERKVVLGEDGRVAEIAPRERLDSHKLIEEFMIAANVAAAETLEDRKAPCVYRVHDRPDAVKLDALREFLQSMDSDLHLAKGQVIQPAHLTQLLHRAAGRPEAELINGLVLRAQAQAIYSPANIGHFGLALRRYAHFTSPIRRYADLIVHRSLVRALALGPGGLSDAETNKLEAISVHISNTERRAAEAERDATDRYVASYLASHVGEIFPGRINGVTKFGLFVTLDQSGADGLVPIRTLQPSDYYQHDEQQHLLVGSRTGQTFRLADRVQVRVVEADPIAGSTLFQIVQGEGSPEPHPQVRRSKPVRGRPRR